MNGWRPKINKGPCEIVAIASGAGGRFSFWFGLSKSASEKQWPLNYLIKIILRFATLYVASVATFPASIGKR